MQKLIKYKYVSPGGKRCRTLSDLIQAVLDEEGVITERRFFEITNSLSYSTALSDLKKKRRDDPGFRLESRKPRGQPKEHYIPDSTEPEKGIKVPTPKQFDEFQTVVGFLQSVITTGALHHLRLCDPGNT
jgi:hypothetical protein